MTADTAKTFGTADDQHGILTEPGPKLEDFGPRKCEHCAGFTNNHQPIPTELRVNVAQGHWDSWESHVFLLACPTWLEETRIIPR